MAKKRKLEAAPLEEENISADIKPDAKGPGMGGMWGNSAMNMLKERLERTRETVAKGVMNGTIAIELLPGQISDPLGSDRKGDWKRDEDYKALRENIRRRGQTQPIRVRPKKKDWRPQNGEPLQSGEYFYIQSGRRRLAACEELGIKVKALISTEEGDAALADLEERFHENTMRKNLTGFEELLSIGLIAEALGDLGQVEIAERLGCAQGDVSLGRACVEHHNQIMREVDVANTPKRAFRQIIPRLKKGLSAFPDRPAPVDPTDVRTANAEVAVKKTAKGYSVNLKTDREVDERWLAASIARLLAASG